MKTITVNQKKSGSVRSAPNQKNVSRKLSKPSLHDRLQKYQVAGAMGLEDLASNPKHLAGYGRS